MSSFPTCQVCHQKFSLKGPAAFLLPCLHSVCETCVTSAAGGVISCSTCQKDINLTETRLQKDVITEKKVLHLTLKHQPELALCTHDDDGNQAVCWCKKCEDFLCENCQMIHNSFKITKRHIVENIVDIKPASFDVDTYCTIHSNYPLDTWDEQCCIPICRICQDGDHAEHKTIVYDKAVETAKKEVAELGEEVQAFLTKRKADLVIISRDLQTLDETCNSLTGQISHTFNTLKTLIVQREIELKIELLQHQEQVRNELNEKKNSSEAGQKECQTSSDYISKTLQYSSRHDIMSLRHILLSKTRECISSVQAIVHESPPLPRFNTYGLEKTKSVLAGFGAITLNDDTVVVKQTKESGSPIKDCMSSENLKQELAQLRTTHEKEMKTLRETLIKKKKGLYIVSSDLSDAAYLLNCTSIEFSRTEYNADSVDINAHGELINRAQPSNTLYSNTRLQHYEGTCSNIPLSFSGSLQYFEVKTKLGIEKTLTSDDLLLEIGLASEEAVDQSHLIAEHQESYSFTVSHCPEHRSICRQVGRHGESLLCLPQTLENTPGTSVTLHYGVVYDSLWGRLAFIDVKNENHIGKIDNVDSSVALWPMFGVYNPHLATVSMSLVVGRDIDVTESKKDMILASLFLL